MATPTTLYCQGIDGIEAAYQKALHSVMLYGPTNFAPIINHVARFASTKQDGSEYFILLIITDGIITDMEQTKCAIVEASILPLSIIIVGVGKENFKSKCPWYFQYRILKIISHISLEFKVICIAASIIDIHYTPFFLHCAVVLARNHA